MHFYMADSKDKILKILFAHHNSEFIMSILHFRFAQLSQM